MCYIGCPYETWDGDCKKKARQICPMEYGEDREDLEGWDQIINASLAEEEAEAMEAVEDRMPWMDGRQE